MPKGLKLEQFKEPAFSSNIIQIVPNHIYINATYTPKNNTDFKFLFSNNYQIKKNEPIAIKPYYNNTYNEVKIYSCSNCTIKETKYLIDENNNAKSFVVLNVTKEPSFNLIDDNLFKNTSINKKSISELISIAYNANIIDETDGQYLFEKLQKLEGINSENINIYIDAIDDQPYTSSKESVLLHYQNGVNLAIETIKKAFSNCNIDILFYDCESYNRETKMPKKCGNTNIIGLKYNYPVRHYISNKLNYNGFIGVQAILHLAHALTNKEYKQTTTFLTVAGNSVDKPKNIEVPIGTPTKEIVNYFKLTCEPKRIILGQAITGISITDVQTPISAITRSVLIFENYTTQKKMECIGCSRCSDVCPQNLLPSYRNKFKQTNNVIFKEFAPDSKCLKCYCCTYICPSHIELV